MYPDTHEISVLFQEAVELMQPEFTIGAVQKGLMELKIDSETFVSDVKATYTTANDLSEIVQATGEAFVNALNKHFMAIASQQNFGAFPAIMNMKKTIINPGTAAIREKVNASFAKLEDDRQPAVKATLTKGTISALSKMFDQMMLAGK